MNTSKKLAWHTVAIAAAALVSAGAAHADSRRDYGDHSRGHGDYREYRNNHGNSYGDGHRRAWRDRDYRYFNHRFESRRYAYPSYGYYRDYPSYRHNYRNYGYPYRHSVVWAAPDFNVGLYIPLR